MRCDAISQQNRCLQGEGSWHTNSSCQTAWLNSVDDFCLWGPPEAGVDVGSFEREGETRVIRDRGRTTRFTQRQRLTHPHFYSSYRSSSP